MEDHLKNKDRLEQEWEGLCAYQAEPNTRTVGMKDGNGKKNRSAAIVACKSFFLLYVPLPLRQRKGCFKWVVALWPVSLLFSLQKKSIIYLPDMIESELAMASTLCV